MNVVLLSKQNWEPSELEYIEEHLGPIVPSTTYDVIMLDRTPGGWRWYAWPRVKRERWLVVAGSLEEMVREVKENEKAN